MGIRACSPTHRLEGGPFVKIDDDAATGESIDEGMILVEHLDHREQIHLQGREFGTHALEQVRNRHHLGAGNLGIQVVSRNAPACLASRPPRLGLDAVVCVHVSLVFALCVAVQLLTPLRL